MVENRGAKRYLILSGRNGVENRGAKREGGGGKGVEVHTFFNFNFWRYFWQNKTKQCRKKTKQAKTRQNKTILTTFWLWKKEVWSSNSTDKFKITFPENWVLLMGRRASQSSIVVWIVILKTCKAIHLSESRCKTLELFQQFKIRRNKVIYLPGNAIKKMFVEKCCRKNVCRFFERASTSDSQKLTVIA